MLVVFLVDDVRHAILCCATISGSIPLTSMACKTTVKFNFPMVQHALVATEKIKLLVVPWIEVHSHTGSYLSKYEFDYGKVLLEF